MMSQCYSLNDEDYKFSSIEELVERYADEEDKTEGIVTFYGGDIVKYKASDFFHNGLMIEILQNDAWDELGEVSEKYLDDTTEEQTSELGKEIKSVIDKWADKYSKHPEFYGVNNIKKYSARFYIDGFDVSFNAMEILS